MMFTKGKIDVTPPEVDYDDKRLELLKAHFQKQL